MASPKLIALFLAFAVAAAALQPSEAARVQAQHGSKPAAASSHEAEKVPAQAAGAGVQSAPTPPGQLPGATPRHPGHTLPAAGRHHRLAPAAAPAAPAGSPRSKAASCRRVLPRPLRRRRPSA
ncbi:unnamed protein product [Urochloa humidicola]